MPILLASVATVTAASAAGSLPPAGSIVGTLRLPVAETPLMAARAGSLFAVVVSPRARSSVTVMREGPRGAVASRRVPFPLPYYLRDVSAGPSGLYAATAVIKRFTRASDVVVRIDAKSLAIVARASFPSSVTALESGRSMWASLGDGRLLRLDPATLQVEGSRRLLRTSVVSRTGASLSRPALGLGSLWVLAGDRRDLELVRLDPAGLGVRSRTRLPAAVASSVRGVVATRGRVYLVASTLIGVGPTGKVGDRSPALPSLDAIAPAGSGWVGLTCCNAAVLRLDSDGRVVARTDLRDGSGVLAVSGESAWLLGDAGAGNGIVHVHLASR